MTTIKQQAALDAKKAALAIAANILVNAEGDHMAAQAVDTAISAAAMVMATAIAGSPEAAQRKALDAAVDLFVTLAKKLSANIDGPQGLLTGMAAALALEKLNRAVVMEAGK